MDTLMVTLNFARSACITLLFFCFSQVQPTAGLTVFIHGNTATFISLLEFYKLSPQSREAQKKFRAHPIIWEDQPILQQGFIELDSAKLQACKQGTLLAPDAQYACYHIVSAYDTVATQVGADTNNYALFGWSGMLSHEKRVEAAYQLYDALCDYSDTFKRQHGIMPVIRIVAHSHGGNVALALADIEKVKKQGLKIELLVMLGSPMLIEMQDCIYSTMFKKIISAYSDGDKVQHRDRFSTKSRKSFKRMHDVANLRSFVDKNPDYVRCDLRVLANNNAYTIDHTNLWHLGRSNKICEALGPLPFAVLMPAVVDSITCKHRTGTVHVSHATNMLSVRVKTCRHGKSVVLSCSINLHDCIRDCCNQIATMWHPADTSGYTLFNKKNMIALRYVFGINS